MHPLDNICPGTCGISAYFSSSIGRFEEDELVLLLLLWASALFKFYTPVRNWSLRSCCTAGNSSQGEAAVLLTQGSGRLAVPIMESCVFLSSRAWGFAGKLQLLHVLDVTRVCTQLMESFRLRAFAFEYWSEDLYRGKKEQTVQGDISLKAVAESEATLENQCNQWSLTF